MDIDLDKLKSTRPVAINEISKEELDKDLELGYKDMLEGRTESADKVFADIRRNYNI